MLSPYFTHTHRSPTHIVIYARMNQQLPSSDVCYYCYAVYASSLVQRGLQRRNKARSSYAHF